MNEMEFNLLDEKWIRVVRPDAAAEEVSLTDALLHAHEYADLAGELPTQDIAVLRLLLAVLHTVFTRYDCQGQEAPLRTANDALRRWKQLWELRHFPEQPLCAYLTAWHERFWLFHSERPFYQVNEAVRMSGTDNGAIKLNGEISQSGHKTRLFLMRSGVYKEQLSYAEAARWLLHLNGFDDTSAKTKEKNLPSMTVAWLGKLGLISAVGENLFETLMLNMVFLQNRKLYEEPEMPYWELNQPNTAQRIQIAMPKNAAGLLTLQSRRILLYRDEDKVTGYRVLGGDFFPEENALQETMTVWSDVADSKGNHQCYRPQRYDSGRQIWRDFSAIVVSSDKQARASGVVGWVKDLVSARILKNEATVNFRITGVKYGSLTSSLTHVLSDQLSFHAELLTEAGVVGYKRAKDEITKVEQAAKYIGWLAEDLQLAAGDRGKNHVSQMREKAQERFFDLVDAPFRRWLAALDPGAGTDALDEQQLVWQKQAKGLALQLSREMVEQAGSAAFVGRTVKVKVKNKDVKKTYNAPMAVNRFLGQLNGLYSSNHEEGMTSE